jgi:hypothetical protein
MSIGRGGPQRTRRGDAPCRGRCIQLVAVVALTALGLLAASGVAAAATHEFVSSFGSFSSPESLAVDQARHLVYVLNRGEGTVDRFDENGQPANFSSSPTYVSGNRLTGIGNPFAFPFGSSESEIAVAPPSSARSSGGDLFVTNREVEIAVFDPTGTYLEDASFDLTSSPAHSYVCGVAVDPAGDVYVADFSTSAVLKYVPTSAAPLEYEFDSELANVPSPCNISASSTTLFVASWPSGPLTAYPLSLFPGGEGSFDASASGSVVEAGGAPVAADASYVDPASDELYVDEGEQVRVFDAGGAVVDEFGAGQGLVESHGVAVDSSLADAYVADTDGGKVDVFAAPRIAAPSVTGLEAVNVTETEARLKGSVNPNSEPTTFRFEYVDDATFQSSGFAAAMRVPVPPGDLGSGFRTVNLTRTIAGLTPGTTYHYRLVASNPLGTGETPPRTFTTFAAEPAQECSNAALRSGLSGALPDCRAYELVTPAVKDYGYGGFPNELFVPAAVGAPDGDSIAYDVGGPLPGAGAGPLIGYDLATRGPAGWQSRSISAPQAPVAGFAGVAPGFWAFSPDLSKAIIETDNPPLTPEAPPDRASLYLQDSDSMTWSLLTPQGAQSLASSAYAGAADDFSRVYYWSLAPQTAGAPPEALGNSQVYGISGGRVFLAGILPDGSVPNSAVPALLSGNNNKDLGVEDVVSADGTRILFKAGVISELYLRFNAEEEQSALGPEDHCTEAAKACTVAVSATRKTNGEGSGGADPNPLSTPKLWAADTTDTRVLFTSRNELTNDADTGRNGSGESTDAGNDLYEYDLATGQLRDLTIGTGPADAAKGANVLGVVGAGDELGDVYFVATGDLGGAAVSGKPNLYVRHDGVTTFIATLNEASDTEDWGESGAFTQDTRRYTARVTPSGRFLAFTSVAPLTGFDNRDAVSNEPDSEVFLYDAASGQLRCVSCNPSGTAPVGPSRITPLKTTGTPFNLPHNLSSDGHRVFFDSSDALVPRDANGEQDVYEYEDGRVFLLSGGIGGESIFADATPNGGDVFFGSFSHLLPQDQDVLRDLYDARVDGGFPPSTSQAPPCGGEGCRGPVGSEPSSPPTASSTLSGRGNVKPKRHRRRHRHRKRHHKHHRKHVGRGHHKGRGAR